MLRDDIMGKCADSGTENSVAKLQQLPTSLKYRRSYPQFRDHSFILTYETILINIGNIDIHLETAAKCKDRENTALPSPCHVNAAGSISIQIGNSQIVIATKLDAESTFVWDNCINFTCSQISLICIQVCNIKHSYKCNLNTINWEINS